MLRRTSPVERVMTYATFLAISLAIHMVVILGDGDPRRATGDAGEAAPTQTVEEGRRR